MRSRVYDRRIRRTSTEHTASAGRRGRHRIPVGARARLRRHGGARRARGAPAARRARLGRRAAAPPGQPRGIRRRQGSLGTMTTVADICKQADERQFERTTFTGGAGAVDVRRPRGGRRSVRGPHGVRGAAGGGTGAGRGRALPRRAPARAAAGPGRGGASRSAAAGAAKHRGGSLRSKLFKSGLNPLTHNR